jgi:predicted double-glycine peptidase
MVLDYLDIHISYWGETTRHAVVVVGIDSEYVYVHDPCFDIAPQRVTRLEFKLAWDEMDNTYATIEPTER